MPFRSTGSTIRNYTDLIGLVYGAHMNMWWFEPLLVLHVKVREVIDEWTEQNHFDAVLAEEYGSQIMDQIDAGRDWAASAPEGEDRQRILAAIEATIAMKDEIKQWFGVDPSR